MNMVDTDAGSALLVQGSVRARRRRILLASSAVIAVVGVAFGVIVGGGESSYRATAQVVLVPGPQNTPDSITSAWESLTSERAASVAAAILAEPQWLGPAAEAAAIPPDNLTITATAAKGTTLIQLTSVAPNPHAAEVALSSVIDNARALVERLSGPVALVYSQPSTGTAVRAGLTPEMAILAGASGLVIWISVTAWAIRDRRSRN